MNRSYFETILGIYLNLDKPAKVSYNIYGTFAFKEIFCDCIFVMYRCNLLNGTIEKIDLENICDKILNDYEEFIENANQN